MKEYTNTFYKGMERERMIRECANRKSKPKKRGLVKWVIQFYVNCVQNEN